MCRDVKNGVHAGGHVRVRSPDATALAHALRQDGARVDQTSDDELAVSNSTTEVVGSIARDNSAGTDSNTSRVRRLIVDRRLAILSSIGGRWELG